MNQEHTCHFCGTWTDEKGYESNGNRHYLSDCRPDLVQHEVGPYCTWLRMTYGGTWSNEKVDQYNEENNLPNCYAYQNNETHEWTAEHQFFYPDKPM